MLTKQPKDFHTNRPTQPRAEDDFTPFRNIMNEWYAKDMSRKMRSTIKTKNSQVMPLVSHHLGTKKTPITLNFGLSTKKVRR